MNETIGARGGKNDRRRVLRIKKKQQKKLQEIAHEEEIKQLEKEVKKKQVYTLIKTLPIVILGGTIKSFLDAGEQKKEVNHDLEVSEYEEGVTPKKDTSTRVITTPEGNKVRVKISTAKKSIFDVVPDIGRQEESSVREQLEDKQIDMFDTIPIDYTFPVDINTQKKIHNLKSRKLVEEYEKELKNIRYDLRQLVFKYNVIVKQEENVVLSEDVEVLIDKLSDVIKKIESLKDKIKIKDLDKYDASYIYILIEDYLQEFKYGKTVSELKDSPLYILIAEKLNELDKAKEKLNKKLQEDKEKYEEREENFDELKEKYYDVDKINKELIDFQIEQEKLLAEIREKISNSIDIKEKVEVQFKSMNRQSKRLLGIMALQMFIPGARTVKALTTATASYLYFMRNVLKPETTTRKIKVITVKDYSKQIERSIEAIDDATKLLGKTSKQVDKMIDEIKDKFKDYIGVIKECDELLANLYKIKVNLKEKEYEMELIKEEQKKELERNEAKVLQRGEYPM
ncbi:MAG: hypothetical protein IJI22_01485 [Bacilli bacterium]|nr:hypothetical protein [Bacilli bacterium]